MNRMAEHACNDCQIYFPANQMRRHSYTSETKSRSYRKDQYGYMNQSGETVHEHKNTIWLCLTCLAERRRAAIRNFFGLVFLGALIVGGLYIYNLIHPKQSQPANLLNETVGGGEATMPADEPSPISIPTPSAPPPEDVSGRTASDQPPPAAPQVESQRESSTAQPVVQAAPDFANVAGAQAAASKAFASGKPERWKDGNLKGWATPSEEVVAGCRSVSFTVDSNPDAPSAPQKVCG